MADTTPAQAPEVGEKPFGLPAAAILAGGVGALVLGLLTTLAEANADIADWLQFNDRVGPLSGKTILAAAAFALTWLVLALVFRDRNPRFRTVVWIAGILLAVGFVMTFPTFFQAFED
jgi:hypothetical protein